MSERSYLNMEGGDFLAAVGDDASKWAAAFCEIASSKGLSIDEDWMIVWFANAIEHSSDVRRRRAPPGSDPSPAPRLDAKEMMRDVFTSWLKHRAAILKSPAEPAATDAMERAERIAKKHIAWDFGHGSDKRDALMRDIVAAITSAVEQAQQRLLPAEPREDLILTIAKTICGQRWSHLNAGEEEREKGRARALYEAIRSRSAEPPKPEPRAYECMMDGSCRRDFVQCEKAGKCLSASPPDTKGGE